jgi:hypothetical protein
LAPATWGKAALDPLGTALLLASLALGVAVLLPGGLRRRLEAFEVLANREPMADALDATVHTLVLRNRGGHTARNIRIVQNALPRVRRFFPATDYTAGESPGEVVLRKIPPRSQVTVTALFDSVRSHDALGTRIEFNGRAVPLCALEDVWTLSRWRHTVLQVLAMLSIVAAGAYALDRHVFSCSGSPSCLGR